MENNSSISQKTIYDIKGSQYEVTRIFSEKRDVKSLIKESISDRKKECFS